MEELRRLEAAAHEAWWEYHRIHPLGHRTRDAAADFEDANWAAIDEAWARYQAAEAAVREYLASR